ncbi:uncharacterized protein LOC142987727 isoform X2 [Anticarsia gemmatalis]|uniref:uncharacterized protein LOC142987727 isoform X2 n=1 Tax=Anticarsia gemmatalis TaxID=129554 RepID=UPI003F75D11E
MTVLTKPSLTVKKVPLIDENRCEEEVIDIHATAWAQSKRYRGAILCMGVIASLLLLMGVITALQIYEQVMNDVQRLNRYQGFCSIPLSRDIQMLEQRKMPLRWRSTETAGRIEPEVQVVSFLDEDPEHLLDLLREVLDINIDDSVEKISVFNNDHPVSFVHDFETNNTGIVDEERCFTMDLDPAVTLPPELLVFGLQRGDEFDVSRVREQLRAVLPSVRDMSRLSREMQEKCQDKPTYLLQKEEGVIKRKRSADAPPHDYMHFAGKRIQEIEISNLAELLEYEQKNKLSA